MTALIRVEEACKTYHPHLPDAVAALAGVSLAVAAGEAVVLRGPSGSGKTSLLSLIGCMARPTSGRVVVNGEEVSRLPERFLTVVRRRTFGFVFQQFHLVRGLSALENVMLPAYPLGVPRGALAEKARGLLDRLGVGHRAGARADWLSGGEAQRVAIARALVNDPTVIVADEPTAHLDSKLSVELLGILSGLKADGKTVVVASHDPLVYQAGVVDRTVSFRDGRVEADTR